MHTLPDQSYHLKTIGHAQRLLIQRTRARSICFHIFFLVPFCVGYKKAVRAGAGRVVSELACSFSQGNTRDSGTRMRACGQSTNQHHECTESMMADNIHSSRPYCATASRGKGSHGEHHQLPALMTTSRSRLSQSSATINGTSALGPEESDDRPESTEGGEGGGGGQNQCQCTAT